MVIESGRHGVTREVMAIVAGLSIQDPRERPLEKRPQADQLHARFVDKTSDFLTLLNLWNHLKLSRRRRSAATSSGALCKAEYLNFLRVREWADVFRQLERMAKPLGLTMGEPGNDGVGIHKSIMAGLLSQLGMRDDTVAASNGKPSKDRDREAGRLHRCARQIRFSHLPRLGAREEAAGGDDERRARRDQPAVRPDERRHRLGRGPSRSPATS
jgi:ATP-dependent helicase HrpA